MQMFVGPRVGTSAGEAGSATAALAALPPPSDPGVSLGVAGGELVAVMQFEGEAPGRRAEGSPRGASAGEAASAAAHAYQGYGLAAGVCRG
jgi:hypothetical protein